MVSNIVTPEISLNTEDFRKVAFSRYGVPSVIFLGKHQLMEQKSSWESRVDWRIKFPLLWNPDGSLPCSQKPTQEDDNEIKNYKMYMANSSNTRAEHIWIILLLPALFNDTVSSAVVIYSRRTICVPEFTFSKSSNGFIQMTTLDTVYWLTFTIETFCCRLGTTFWSVRSEKLQCASVRMSQCKTTEKSFMKFRVSGCPYTRLFSSTPRRNMRESNCDLRASRLAPSSFLPHVRGGEQDGYNAKWCGG